jgi:hypothetical protein
MHDEDGTTDFVGVLEDRLIEERECTDGGPTFVRVEGTGVITTFCLVVVAVLFNELGHVIRDGKRNATTCTRVFASFVFFCAQSVDFLLFGESSFF